MPSKNDLSAFKDKAAKTILPPANDGAGRKAARGPLTGKKTVGRPKKKPAEKRDYKITLSLTDGEGHKVQEKAGLAPEAAVIYDHLLKNGFFK